MKTYQDHNKKTQQGQRGSFKHVLTICVTLCLTLSVLTGCTKSKNASLDSGTDVTGEKVEVNDTQNAVSQSTSEREPFSDGAEPSAENEFAAQTATEPVTVTLGHDLDASHAEILQGLTKAFNETNQEGVTAKLISLTETVDTTENADHTATEEETPATSAVPVDIWLTDIGRLSELETKAVSLNDFLKAHPENFRQFRTTLLDASAVTGIVYGLPFSVQSDLVFYNVTLLEEAEATVPADPESFQTAAEKVMKKRQIPLLGVCTGGDSQTSFFEDVLRGFGATLTAGSIPGMTVATGEGTADGVQIGFDTLQGEQAISLLLKLFRKGYIKTYDDADRMRQDFLNGTIGGFLGTSADLTFTKAERFKTEPALIPFATKKTGALVMKDLFFLTTDEKTARAASVFLAYLTAENTATLWAVGTGDLPVTEASFDFKEYRSLTEIDAVSRVLADQEISFFFADKSKSADRICDELKYRLTIHAYDEVTAKELIEEIAAQISDKNGQD